MSGNQKTTSRDQQTSEHPKTDAEFFKSPTPEICEIARLFKQLTSGKTNMAIETTYKTSPSEDVFPIKNGTFSSQLPPHFKNAPHGSLADCSAVPTIRAKPGLQIENPRKLSPGGEKWK